ncbi:MAG: phosphopantetheine-binding protein, partial [Micromonosporaceae bacterium]
DSEALPAPPRATGDVAPSPVDEVTGEVTEIWLEVLGLDIVGVDEDLFELGGHSLTVTQIASRIRKRLGVDLPIHVFYDRSTVAGVAAAVTQARTSESGRSGG